MKLTITALGKRNRRQVDVLEGLDAVYRSLRSYVVAREKGERSVGMLEPAANRPGDGRE